MPYESHPASNPEQSIKREIVSQMSSEVEKALGKADTITIAPTVKGGEPRTLTMPADNPEGAIEGLNNPDADPSLKEGYRTLLHRYVARQTPGLSREDSEAKVNELITNYQEKT